MSVLVRAIVVEASVSGVWAVFAFSFLGRGSPFAVSGGHAKDLGWSCGSLIVKTRDQNMLAAAGRAEASKGGGLGGMKMSSLDWPIGAERC